MIHALVGAKPNLCNGQWLGFGHLPQKRIRLLEELTQNTLRGCLAAVFLCVPQAVAEPLTAIVDFQLEEPIPDGGVPLAADSDSTLGWSFTVNSQIEVTSLGFFDSGLDGLSEPHRVGIWNANEELLAWAQVDAGDDNPLIGHYRYATVEPLTLDAGQTYVIGATVPLGNPLQPAVEPPQPIVIDTYPFFNVVHESILKDSRISLVCTSRIFRGQVGPNFTPGPGLLNFPDEVIEDGYFFAPNFRFVPEPGTLGLLVFGGLGILRSSRRK
ncbi:MAG: DUF4082 domain-containing protein [Planctomycetota bacterium]|nr:DUF4082 domain-containing protein [Planctomycetota bacterium]